MSKLTKSISKRIDELEQAMVDGVLSGELQHIECELQHEFKNGYYERTITMPKGMLICSKIHLTRHEFVIFEGSAAVKVNDGTWKLLSAPYYGVTEPNTRRILFITETCKWRTYHKLKEGEATPEQVEDRIIKKHKHPFVEYKQQINKLCHT